MNTTFVPVPFFTTRAIVPKQGPKNGSQYLKISRSGRRDLMVRPTDTQLSGSIESRMTLLGTRNPSASPSSLCVFPGKRNPGYCRVNVTTSTSL